MSTLDTDNIGRELLVRLLGQIVSDVLDVFILYVCWDLVFVKVLMLPALSFWNMLCIAVMIKCIGTLLGIKK